MKLLCAVARGIIQRENEFVFKLQAVDEQVSRLVELEDIAKNMCAMTKTKSVVEAESLRTHDFIKCTLTALKLCEYLIAMWCAGVCCLEVAMTMLLECTSNKYISTHSPASDQKDKFSSQPPASQSGQRRQVSPCPYSYLHTCMVCVNKDHYFALYSLTCCSVSLQSCSW